MKTRMLICLISSLRLTFNFLNVRCLNCPKYRKFIKQLSLSMISENYKPDTSFISTIVDICKSISYVCFCTITLGYREKT